MRSSGWWAFLAVPYFIYMPKEKLSPCVNLASVPSDQVLVYLLGSVRFPLRKTETKSCTLSTVHTHEVSVWNELKSPVDLFQHLVGSASVARKPYFMSRGNLGHLLLVSLVKRLCPRPTLQDYKSRPACSQGQTLEKQATHSDIGYIHIQQIVSLPGDTSFGRIWFQGLKQFHRPLGFNLQML